MGAPTLLIGPPGSGKTEWILERLATAVKEGRAAKVRLLTPTASMARHLLHELGRRGLTVPGSLVTPVARLVAELTPDLTTATPAVTTWLLERAVEEKGDRLGEAGKTPGGIRRLARAIDDLEAARVTPDQLRPELRTAFERGLGEIYALHQRFLASHDRVSRAERVFRAAEEAPFQKLAEEIYFDGFFDFSPGERDLVTSLATSGATIVATLPADPPEGLFPGFGRERLPTVRRKTPHREVFLAAGPAEEVSEIARRILEARRSGRLLREIGVIVRQPETYASTIQAVFERYGIPFRFRRPRPLGVMEPVGFLTRLLRSAADGFPGEETLEALGRAASKVGSSAHGHAFARRVEKQLPGEGLELFQKEAGTVIGPILDDLAVVDQWRRQRVEPEEWARRLERLATTQTTWPNAPDGLASGRMLERRAFGAAWAGWVGAVTQTAELLRLKGRMQVSFNEFIEALESVVRTARVTVSDERRDVVNVLSAYEARQWELPVVFVLGMVEGWFPQAPSEDVFLHERLRKRLRGLGLPIRTEREITEDEQFLFEIASSRASEQLIFSYPELDHASAPLLRSFLLPAPKQEEGDTRIKPVAPREEPAVDRTSAGARFDDPAAVRAMLEQRAVSFSPSALKTFQNCAFAYFSDKTLGLKTRPTPINQRLNALEKGAILHETLANWSKDRERPIVDALEDAFAKRLDELNLPGTFRTAMVLAGLRSDLERFVTEDLAATLPGADEQEYEYELKFAIEGDEALQVNGRIDRYETLSGQAAVVVDYKSGTNQLKTLAEGEQSGKNLQGSLYLAGLRSKHGLQPGGMLYVGLRGATGVSGWLREDILRSTPFPKDVSRVTAQELNEMVDMAEKRTAAAAERIRSGHIAVEPNDPDHCRKFCDFREVCRVRL